MWDLSSIVARIIEEESDFLAGLSWEKEYYWG